MNFYTCYILHQSPDTIGQFEYILSGIINGTRVIGNLALVVSQYPELSLLASKLLNLMVSGASAHEIFTVLVSLSQSLGISLQVFIQLLQIIGGMVII